MKIRHFCLVLVLLFSGCATGTYVTSEDFVGGNVKDNSVCVISENWDLKGEIVTIPANCTLSFKKGSYVYNGTINGNNTKIKYDAPFIGEAVTLNGCEIIGKKVIRDTDVFINVRHTQKEIQTLFDISKGVKAVFSKGVYKDIERIVINNNIDADFLDGTIQLYHDSSYVAECFYMDPWPDNGLDYCRIKNLIIKGKRRGLTGSQTHRSCIQLFNISEVVLDNIFIDEFYGGPNEYQYGSNGIIQHKKLIGTNAVNIFNYDRCIINRCRVHNIGKEIFWCVPNQNPNNITYFTNNISTCSFSKGSASFFTIIDGRCVVNNNSVYNYNGSAFNTFCYDSEISNNKFYDGKRSVAIDLSEGTKYRSRNVVVHDNECTNTKGLIAFYGENIRIENNRWVNNQEHTEKRIFLIAVRTRGERLADGEYIDCDNNPEIEAGSRNITIAKNVLINDQDVVDSDIRCAIIYGDDISFSKNKMSGFNLPAVQFYEGKDLSYTDNSISDSKNCNNVELFINKGKNITIKNNYFSQNFSKEDLAYTVQVLSAEGNLVYKGNRSSTDALLDLRGKTYIPCLIKDDSKLQEADIFVKSKEDGFILKTGLKSEKIITRTNIQKR